MCKCSVETEITLRFLLCYRLCSTIRTELLDDIYTFASSLTNYHDEKLLNILLHGSEYFSYVSYFSGKSINFKVYNQIFEKF